MNWLQALKHKFIPSASMGDGLNSIKSQFGKIGEIIHQEPGLRYYKIEGSDDILEVGIKEITAGKSFKFNSFGITRLIPSDISHSAYRTKVGEMANISSCRSKSRITKCYGRVKELTPEDFEHKFEPGKVSREHTINGKSYFCPKFDYISNGGYANITYPKK